MLDLAATDDAALAAAKAGRMPDELTFDGPGSEVAARARGVFAAFREARAAAARAEHARGTPLVRLGTAVAVLALGAAVAWHPIALLGLVPALMLSQEGDGARSHARYFEVSGEAAPEIQALLAMLLPELHPRGRAEVRIDLRRTEDAVAPLRTATSPRSRLPLRWYRHVHFRLRAPLVDGSPLALELARCVKMKAGWTKWSRLEVRGRLAPRHGQLAGERRFGPLTATGVERDGHPEVVFWGAVQGPDELAAALRGLGLAIHGTSA